MYMFLSILRYVYLEIQIFNYKHTSCSPLNIPNFSNFSHLQSFRYSCWRKRTPLDYWGQNPRRVKLGYSLEYGNFGGTTVSLFTPWRPAMRDNGIV